MAVAACSIRGPIMSGALKSRLLMIAICAIGTCFVRPADASAAGNQPLGIGCTVTPFQASVDLSIVTESISRTARTTSLTAAIPLSGPSRIQFLSIRFNDGDHALVAFMSAHVTAKLSGQAVTHAIELPPPDLSVVREVSVSRQYTFYADAQSSLRFDVEVWFPNAPHGEIAGGEFVVTVVGQTTSVGCGLGG